MYGVNAISNHLFKPMNSTVKTAGQIGSFVGKKVVELAGPQLIKEASVRAAIAAVGNSTLGSAVGICLVPILSPVITPVAAYGAGMMASYWVTYAGNFLYEAIAKPENPLERLDVQHKGLVESVGPGMVANGLIKGLELAIEGTPAGKIVGMVSPIAVPLVAEAVSGLAKHIFV